MRQRASVIFERRPISGYPDTTWPSCWAVMAPGRPPVSLSPDEGAATRPKEAKAAARAIGGATPRTIAPMFDSDEPSVAQQIGWLLDDLEAAQSVRDTLPAASRDRRLIDATIAHLNGEILALVASDGFRPTQDGRLAAEEERALTDGTGEAGTPDVVRRLADWRVAERVTDSAQLAADSAAEAARTAERAASLAERVAEAALRVLETAGDTSDRAGETADILRYDARRAAEAAAEAIAQAESARAAAMAAKTLFHEAHGEAFDHRA